MISTSHSRLCVEHGTKKTNLIFCECLDKIYSLSGSVGGRRARGVLEDGHEGASELLAVADREPKSRNSA